MILTLAQATKVKDSYIFKVPKQPYKCSVMIKSTERYHFVIVNDVTQLIESNSRNIPIDYVYETDTLTVRVQDIIKEPYSKIQLLELTLTEQI